MTWRERIYAWGRSAIPIRYRREIRRRLSVEKLFGIRKGRFRAPLLSPALREEVPGRPDFVFLPGIEWGFRRQRPQQLARALAELGSRVFYAEFDAEIFSVAFPGVILFRVEGARREDLHERRLEGERLSRCLESVAALQPRFEVREAVILVEAPYWRPLAEELRRRFGWKIVYDCIDDHGAFSTAARKFLEGEETALAATADLVFATSPALCEKIATHGTVPILLRNAGEFEFFAGAAEPTAKSQRPTIGYYGAVADWFDSELVTELARKRPDWDFEIVGSTFTGQTSAWNELANLRAPGEVPYERLPEILSRFDVAIIPFRATPLTEATDPVKIYEIFAAGKPVVATPIRELRSLAGEGLLRVAGDAAGFERAIEASLSEKNPALKAQRVEFARRNTWRKRAGSLLEHARGLFPRVSVVVITFDNRDYNEACLRSLGERTDWPNLELIFVDNGSTDGTADWLAEEERRTPCLLRVIRNAENRGFAAAANQGLSAATGEFLCLLNNDTVVTRGWLSALVAHLQRNPRLGMVGPSTNEIANEAKIAVGYANLADLPPWANAFTASHAGEAEPIPMLAMFCAVVPRLIYATVGPLDERFSIGMFEDDDYCRRVRNAGYELACARDSFVHHQGRASFEKLGDQEYLRIYRENERKYIEKWNESPTPTPSRSTLPPELASREGVIVFLPSIGWNVALVQRPHHLARALARAGQTVVFDCGENPADDFSGFREIEPELFLYRGEASALRALLRAPVLWSFTYNVPAANDWPNARLVYDCIDHPAVFPYPRRELDLKHADALERADAVFAVSSTLRQEIAARRPDVVYLPNAVDFAAFGEATPRPADPGRRPTAIYTGAFARWFDEDLLADVAARLPGWDFLLYGHLLDESPIVQKLSALGNVRFGGIRPNREIPALLAAADVAIIPFRVSEETARVSPVKLYEYFAAGRPVVSTPMPEVEVFAEAAVAASPGEWALALPAALARSRDAAFTERVRAVARANDWSARARTILERLVYSGSD
jgi:GT2 family glycosyltransferase